MKNVLITDLDNTLFDWFTLWYESFNEMLIKASEISKIPICELKKEIRIIHQKHGTAEYSFVLEEIPQFKEIYGERENIVSQLDEAIHAFRSARKKNLKMYPTVYETLTALKNRGVKIVAYTESKEYYSNYRISKLGLDGVIDILYSPKDHLIPTGVQSQNKYDLIHTVNAHTPENEIKPNPKILLDIISGIGAKKEFCVYVGDSEMKDISMAKEAGVDAVFAKYGTSHFTNNIEGYNLLRDVTHWTDADVERERKIKENNKDIHADYVIERFSELLELFKFKRFE
ncbi:HAD family hydrolase [Pantoea agglomerans]|uniref:HAD family hydrolase n=1 Tax=Enterobacter agglomerans TaxID=549 RepID=UPI0017861EF7|nr:HAD hydrolase-like protein [Pantoea agglomerans]MBD8199128.1 HAD family hydrolase [Pantoea agglomerans]